MDEQRNTVDTAGIQRGTEQFAATLNTIGAAYQRAKAEWAAKWPPERVLSSLLGEYGRRMAEFNRRGSHG